MNSTAWVTAFPIAKLETRPVAINTAMIASAGKYVAARWWWFLIRRSVPEKRASAQWGIPLHPRIEDARLGRSARTALIAPQGTDTDDLSLGGDETVAGR